MTGWTVVLAAILAANPKAATYSYVAETAGSVRISGVVTAAGIDWNCAGNRCTTTGPWPTPAVAACQALARRVGPISAYGHKDQMLAPAELQQCNAGIAPAADAALPGLQPGVPASKVVLPAAGKAFAPKTVTTGELQLTGRRFAPKTVTTGELHLTGRRFAPKMVTTGELQLTGRRFAPKTVTTGELQLTGRRFAPKTVTTGELQLTGQRSGGK